MKIIACEGIDEFTQAASNWCRTSIGSLGSALGSVLGGVLGTGPREEAQGLSMYIPAGQTPVSLYELWEKEKPAYLQGVKLVQIDDVLTGNGKGTFQNFFRTHLPNYQTQVQFIQQADQRADLAILGLGLNGHVAFHEPGLPQGFFSGCVPLSARTCQTLQLEPGAWGVSYGVGAFVETKAILLMVKGESKREILERLLGGDSSLPASALLTHPNLTLLADSKALPQKSR